MIGDRAGRFVAVGVPQLLTNRFAPETVNTIVVSRYAKHWPIRAWSVPSVWGGHTAFMLGSGPSRVAVAVDGIHGCDR